MINRISTVMVNMYAPKAGGATVWPFLGVSVFPEKGSAVWWFNTKTDSVPDPETKHAACPVLYGQKWSKFFSALITLSIQYFIWDMPQIIIQNYCYTGPVYHCIC